MEQTDDDGRGERWRRCKGLLDRLRSRLSTSARAHISEWLDKRERCARDERRARPSADMDKERKRRRRREAGRRLVTGDCRRARRDGACALASRKSGARRQQSRISNVGGVCGRDNKTNERHADRAAVWRRRFDDDDGDSDDDASSRLGTSSAVADGHFQRRARRIDSLCAAAVGWRRLHRRIVGLSLEHRSSGTRMQSYFGVYAQTRSAAARTLLWRRRRRDAHERRATIRCSTETRATFDGIQGAGDADRKVDCRMPSRRATKRVERCSSDDDDDGGERHGRAARRLDGADKRAFSSIDRCSCGRRRRANAAIPSTVAAAAAAHATAATTAAPCGTFAAASSILAASASAGDDAQSRCSRLLWAARRRRDDDADDAAAAALRRAATFGQRGRVAPSTAAAAASAAAAAAIGLRERRLRERRAAALRRLQRRPLRHEPRATAVAWTRRFRRRRILRAAADQRRRTRHGAASAAAAKSATARLLCRFWRHSSAAAAAAAPTRRSTAAATANAATAAAAAAASAL